jgi:class 3 adenylate cyclase
MARDLEVAIVFADVVGSTQLYDKFGDTKASETVALCLDVMKDATYQFNGTVIKTIGDEVMSTFDTVDEAMGAAVMMQSRVTSETRKNNGIPVSIRIGCHYGPVVQEQNDIFGAAVHTANRMTSQAKARQIVISGFTVEQMSPELRNQARQIDVATVRGRVDEVALFELVCVQAIAEFPRFDGRGFRQAQGHQYGARGRQRPGGQRQPDIQDSCQGRDATRQVHADRPEHQRDVPAEPPGT